MLARALRVADAASQATVRLLRRAARALYSARTDRESRFAHAWPLTLARRILSDAGQGVSSADHRARPLRARCRNDLSNPRGLTSARRPAWDRLPSAPALRS